MQQPPMKKQKLDEPVISCCDKEDERNKLLLKENIKLKEALKRLRVRFTKLSEFKCEFCTTYIGRYDTTFGGPIQCSNCYDVWCTGSAHGDDEYGENDGAFRCSECKTVYCFDCSNKKYKRCAECLGEDAWAGSKCYKCVSCVNCTIIIINK